MKIARIESNGKILFAEVKNGGYYPAEGNIFGDFTISREAVTADKLLAPVSPGKIIALGANYRKHAEELGLNINKSPTIFMKPPSAVLEPYGDIIYPKEATKVDYEAELAVIIKKCCRKVKKENANEVILGYTCANDVSERVFQKLDGQWTRAKGYDTFCPLGSYIETEVNPDGLKLETLVNGEVRQSGNTSDMIHGIGEIIEFVTGIMTLDAGDVILTGTPDGIGEIKIGDSVEIVIEKIGSIKNKVTAER